MAAGKHVHIAGFGIVIVLVIEFRVDALGKIQLVFIVFGFIIFVELEFGEIFPIRYDKTGFVKQRIFHQNRYSSGHANTFAHIDADFSILCFDTVVGHYPDNTMIGQKFTVSLGLLGISRKDRRNEFGLVVISFRISQVV